MADRVELHTVFGVLRQRAWVSGNEGGSTHQRIEVGQLADSWTRRQGGIWAEASREEVPVAFDR